MAASKGIRKVALAIEGHAAALAPVDTGTLRASIYSETADGSTRDAALGAAGGLQPEGASFEPASVELEITDELQAKVAAAAHYGAFVELGTERAPAQPYLGPAADSISPQADSIVGREIQNAIKGD